MEPDLKEVISGMVAEALIYLYTDVGPKTDYQLINERVELEVVVSEVEILKHRHDLIEVGVLEHKGTTHQGHSRYGLTRAWETSRDSKAN